MIYWSWNLSFYLLHRVAKPNSQLRASSEQTRQAGVAVVVWDGERHESERWGLSGLCVGRFKGDRALFLLMKLLLLVIPSFSPCQREDTQRPSIFLHCFQHYLLHIFLFFLDSQGGVSPGLEGQDLGQDQGRKAEKSCCRWKDRCDYCCCTGPLWYTLALLYPLPNPTKAVTAAWMVQTGGRNELFGWNA